MDSIINNSYVVGVGGRNLVLSTLGRIYVKVGDRYTELDFNKLVNSQGSSSGSTEEKLPDIIVIDSQNDLASLEFPGNNKIVISNDNNLWLTSNDRYEAFDFSANIHSLALEDLSVKNQVAFEVTNEAPFIVNSNALVANLNAQFLDGVRVDELAIKANDEVITGEWGFKEKISLNGAIVDNTISNWLGNTVIDYKNDIITTDVLNVRQINFPQENTLIHLTGGLPGEIWLHKEFDISNVQWSDIVIDSYSNFNIIQEAYNCGYLSNSVYSGIYDTITDVPIEFWYNIFLSNYVIIDDDNPPIIRDLTITTELNYVNVQLSSNQLPDIYNYIKVFYALFRMSGESVTNYFQVLVPNLNLVSYPSLFPNMIIKSSDNQVRAAILLTNRQDNFIIVQLDTSGNQFSNQTKFVVGGHLYDPQLKPSIVLNSHSNKYPFIDILKNANYNYEYNFGEETGTDIPYNLELADNNNVLCRNGVMDGLAEDITFKKMKGAGIFMNGKELLKLQNLSDVNIAKLENDSGIYIKNPTIAFGSDTTIDLPAATFFLPDGSGQIAGGKLKWTADTLSIGASTATIQPLTINLRHYNTGALISTYTYDGSQPLTIDIPIPVPGV